MGREERGDRVREREWGWGKGDREEGKGVIVGLQRSTYFNYWAGFYAHRDLPLPLPAGGHCMITIEKRLLRDVCKGLYYFTRVIRILRRRLYLKHREQATTVPAGEVRAYP